jgi:outer membrane protein TolC
MRCMRLTDHAVIPGLIGLASTFLLLLTASSVPPPASAQTAGEDKITPALLSLRQELPETLVKITPELLGAQKQLVEALRLGLEGVRDEERVGQRTVEDVFVAELAYFRELEALKVMEARRDKDSISERELLKVRLEVRSEALSVLKQISRHVEGRHRVGEVTRTDVELTKAAALKAEIMLQALKSAAGE